MTVNRNLKYQYVCEKCGITTDFLNTTIIQAEPLVKSGKKEIMGGQVGNIRKVVRRERAGKNILDEILVSDGTATKELNKYIDITIKALQKYLNSTDRYISNPFLAERFNEAFTEHICPICEHGQSWYPAITESPIPLKSARTYAMGFVLVGLCVFLCVNLLQTFFPIWYLFVIGGCAITGAVFGYIKSAKDKKHIDAHWNNATIHNKPEIVWVDVVNGVSCETYDGSDEDDSGIFF